MSEVKNILRRAIKHGFDLAAVPNYTEHSFRSGLFTYLVDSDFCVFEEEEELYIGFDPFLDIARVSIEGFTMKVVPLHDEGFFEILIQLFKYITFACKVEKNPESDDEISTESYSEEDSSSEELWL